jgi:O-antigen biosynthesis protein
MKISIVIPVYNKLEYTKKCLVSLKKNTQEIFLNDVILVDNASSDGSEAYLKKMDWIKYIKNKENLGFAKACNQGAKKSSGEIIVFLNNDTEVQNKWLEPLLEKLKNDEVAIVGSKLLFPNNTIQHAGVVISNDKLPRHIYYQDDPSRPYVNRVREFKAVTAACMAVRREVFFQVNGFDEEYINGMEDIDLCLKIYEKGFKVVYNPKSVIIHHESVSSGRFKHNDFNNNLFLSRWSHVEPDEQKNYKLDNRPFLYRLNIELRNIFYGQDFSSKPIYWKLAKSLYIVVQKFLLILTLLIRGDFQAIKSKVKKYAKS